MPKELESVNDLRRLYFLTVNTSVKNHQLPYKPRFLNFLYAIFNGYFWSNCDLCDTPYGGHEAYGSDDRIMRCICPKCTLEHYNKTGKFHIAKPPDS